MPRRALRKTLLTEQRTSFANDSVAARRETRTKMQRAAVERTKALILASALDLMMPTGKVLGDCSGAECVRTGGYFKKIGERLKPQELVRDKFTNEKLATLFES
jgi:hypothetical protein